MRHAETHLEPGEQTVTACVCRMKGTMTANALGGVAGLLVAKKRGQGAREEAAAAGFPLEQSMVLVVTDRRLLVLQGKKLLGAMAATELAGAEVVKKNSLSDWTVRIDMGNGAQVTLEANRVMKPARLVEAIQMLAAA